MLSRWPVTYRACREALFLFSILCRFENLCVNLLSKSVLLCSYISRLSRWPWSSRWLGEQPSKYLKQQLYLLWGNEMYSDFLRLYAACFCLDPFRAPKPLPILNPVVLSPKTGCQLQRGQVIIWTLYLFCKMGVFFVVEVIHQL